VPGTNGAGHRWSVPYGEKVTKAIKTFTATGKPAGGTIGVVLVKEQGGWLAYFGTDTAVTAEQILEALAQRTARWCLRSIADCRPGS
jgi:hypothetical protein